MHEYLPILALTADSFGIGLFYFMIGLSLASVAVWAIVKIVQVIQKGRELPDDELPEEGEDKEDNKEE
jgi:hypothetical protein